MDKQDWADRLRKEIEEVLDRARTTAFQAVHATRIGDHEAAGQKALEAVADDARLVHLNELLCRLHAFRFDSEIDAVYADISALVEADVLIAQAKVAAWNAAETMAIVGAMREPCESLSARHFLEWSRLDPEERDRWRRIFGETERRLGGPCLCNATTFLREELGNCGLWKCSSCCAVWPPQVNGPGQILELPWHARRREAVSPRRHSFRAAEAVRKGDLVALDIGTGEVRPVKRQPTHPSDRRALEQERKLADIMTFRGIAAPEQALIARDGVAGGNHTPCVPWTGTVGHDGKPLDCECAHPPPWSPAWSAWKTLVPQMSIAETCSCGAPRFKHHHENEARLPYGLRTSDGWFVGAIYEHGRLVRWDASPNGVPAEYLARS